MATPSSKMDGKFADGDVCPGETGRGGKFVGDVCPGMKVGTGSVGGDITQRSAPSDDADAWYKAQNAVKYSIGGYRPGLGGK